jgi:hypothetical protein
MTRMNEFYAAENFDAVAYKEYLKQIKIEKNVLSYLVPEGNKILRSRLNDNRAFFDEISKLSYPPICCARTDRASLEGKPMFYGSVFTHLNGEIVPPKVINLIESSDFFKDKQAIGCQLLTQSAWMNSRPLKFAMFPTSLKYNIPCDEVRHIQEEFYNVAASINMNLREASLYIGDMFAMDNTKNTYNITAYAVDYLLNDTSDSAYFDGVIYPSVPSEGVGMNVCFRPSLIDSGVVQFLGATVTLLIKDGMEAKLSHLFDCNVVGEGNLIWHKSDMLKKAYQNPLLFPDLLSL